MNHSMEEVWIGIKNFCMVMDNYNCIHVMFAKRHFVRFTISNGIQESTFDNNKMIFEQLSISFYTMIDTDKWHGFVSQVPNPFRHALCPLNRLHASNQDALMLQKTRLVMKLPILTI